MAFREIRIRKREGIFVGPYEIYFVYCRCVAGDVARVCGRFFAGGLYGSGIEQRRFSRQRSEWGSAELCSENGHLRDRIGIGMRGECTLPIVHGDGKAIDLPGTSDRCAANTWKWIGDEWAIFERDQCDRHGSGFWDADGAGDRLLAFKRDELSVRGDGIGNIIQSGVGGGAAFVVERQHEVTYQQCEWAELDTKFQSVDDAGDAKRVMRGSAGDWFIRVCKNESTHNL